MANVTNISSALDDHLNKDPAQKDNVAAMKNFIAANGGKNLPDGRRPILYAIGGIAGVSTVTEYGEKLEAEWAKDHNVKALTWVSDSDTRISYKSLLTFLRIQAWCAQISAWIPPAAAAPPDEDLNPPAGAN